MSYSADQAELACVAGCTNYRAEATVRNGERIERARAVGIWRLFVLTTVTSHWFPQRGFVEGPLTRVARARLSNRKKRRSKIFAKTLTTGSHALGSLILASLTDNFYGTHGQLHQTGHEAEGLDFTLPGRTRQADYKGVSEESLATVDPHADDDHQRNRLQHQLMPSTEVSCRTIKPFRRGC